MLKTVLKFAPVLWLAVFTQAHAEQTRPINFTNPYPPTQNIFLNNTNLTVKEFFSAYTSKSTEERRYAELYLLGAVDATEGKSWCDYRTFKTLTLDEEIYTGLKSLDKSRQNERAAYVIAEILSKRFPCRGK